MSLPQMTRDDFVACIEAGIKGDHASPEVHAKLREVGRAHVGPVARGSFVRLLPDGGECGCPATVAGVRVEVRGFPFAYDDASARVLGERYTPKVFEVVG